MNPGGLQINNKNMEYVVAVAQYDSITAAAESLYISQPALSRFISNLENASASRCSSAWATVSC